MAKKSDQDPQKIEGHLSEERRRHKRIKKNFILTYFDVSNPSQKFEITQLKNIGKGGICFITTRSFASATKIGIELKTPYLSGTTYLEGVVLESHEKIKNLLYETRLQFTSVEPQAEFLLNKVIEFFTNGESK